MDESKLSISQGIVQSLSKLRDNNELNDFEVIVDGETFSCHSVILASCSDFFRCLLRSNMKEKLEMKVHLSNISSSIFRLILNTLYTGRELLTQENVLNVWSAVHQLQMPFLIQHCEDFIESNLPLDTLDIYKQHAEHLQSERICKYIFNFMCENFGTFRKTEVMLHLTFEDLMEIIKSDSLKVTSEDEVLFSIAHWVDYGQYFTKIYDPIKAAAIKESEDFFLSTVAGILSTGNKAAQKEGNLSSNANCKTLRVEQHVEIPLTQKEVNERIQFLIPLLTSCRSYLASQACIMALYKTELIQNYMLAKEYLIEAFSFKYSNDCHGYWPTAAIYRDCSNLEHVGVYCQGRTISALSFKQNKWCSIQKFPKHLDVKLTVLKGKLYACIIGSPPNQIYVLQTNVWVPVIIISHAVQLLLSHEKYIYVFDSSEKNITRFNPNIEPVKLETFKHWIENPAYILSVQNNIIIFNSVDNNEVEETAVHSWNTDTLVCTKFENLNFSAKNMTSFRDDRKAYILDSNGNLLQLTNTHIIEFTFVAKLWSGHYNIKGALLFRETLFIFGNFPHNLDVLDRAEGVFSSNTVWEIPGQTSNFVHLVISVKELTPEQPTA